MSKLHYLHTGNSGNKILLIHGNVASANWWRPAMELLQDRFNLVAVDLKGYGDSGPGEKDVTILRHAQDIVETLDELEFFPCVAVGHSLGGAVAMELAKVFPNKISKLVLVDSAKIAGMGPYDYNLLEQVVENVELLKSSLKATFFQPIPKEIESTLLGDCVKAKDAFIPNTKALTQVNYTEAAEEFFKPVLVLRGEKDVFISAEEAEKIKEAYPNSELKVITGSGHNPPLEATGLFCKEIAKFVGEQNKEK